MVYYLGLLKSASQVKNTRLTRRSYYDRQHDNQFDEQSNYHATTVSQESRNWYYSGRGRLRPRINYHRHCRNLLLLRS